MSIVVYILMILYYWALTDLFSTFFIRIIRIIMIKGIFMPIL